jgi:Tfp pilus assembly PilM family ATPase
LDEVIDVYVAQTWLDEKLIDPFSFGQNGRELRAQVLLATHPKILLADILSGLNSCGIEVSEFRSGFFGLARALSALRPGVENAVLIDIGHSTTTGVMTIGGSVQQVFSVPAGSHHITRDLMVALSEAEENAEKIKLAHGLTSSPEGVDLGKYIRPRVAEILALSLKNFAIYAKALDGGLMFCGNGPQLLGFAAFAGRAMGVEAPFICSLSGKTASSFLDAKVKSGSQHIDSGWLVLFSHLRCYLEEQSVRRFERDSKPLAKLRPLWTWLSELSR